LSQSCRKLQKVRSELTYIDFELTCFFPNIEEKGDREGNMRK
jgi:hypothetical protein